VNESLTLALQMQSRQDGNMALEQCIDLERDSLDRLNATMFLVAEMNLRSPEKTDALTYMSAVIAVTQCSILWNLVQNYFHDLWILSLLVLFSH
jgi:hypothetical protein